METIIKKDLSFLTRKEKAIIQDVLNRDTVLRKREKKRIGKMKVNTDPRHLKLITGEWFEDLQSDRYIDYSSATDLLKGAFRERHGIECLTSIGRKWFLNSKLCLQAAQKTLKESTRPHIESLRREAEKMPSTHPKEERSITEILKDLEVILDRELESNTSSSDSSNRSGFGPENDTLDTMLPVDYNKHNVWCYPAHLSPINEENNLTISPDPSTSQEEVPGITPENIGLQELPTILSPVEGNRKVTVKFISASAYRRITGDNLHSIHKFNLKARVSKCKDFEIINKPAPFDYSGFAIEPFCSSPFDSEEMDVFQNCGTREMDALHDVCHPPNESSAEKQDAQNSTDFDWSSVDTDITIEQSTILATDSPSLMEYVKPLDNRSSQSNIDENLEHHER